VVLQKEAPLQAGFKALKLSTHLGAVKPLPSTRLR